MERNLGLEPNSKVKHSPLYWSVLTLLKMVFTVCEILSLQLLSAIGSYIKDAWMAILDHFWLGAGGEAWRYININLFRINATY